MNQHDQVTDSLRKSNTPSLSSQAVIAQSGLELHLDPTAGPPRKLRVRPNTKEPSWWFIEHSKTTGTWRVAGAEPLTNVDLTILTASG